MIYLLAALPILIVLTVMAGLRWGGQRAGPVGWLAGLVVAGLAFGLTPQIFVVSQLKGLYLSFYVLWVLWPALLLYNVVNQIGGIRAMADWLEGAIYERSLLVITLAWIFSAWLEGLAGFGLPIAVVSPMLVGLGVEPLTAVAAVAIGHAWSVTFGDMGVIYQTLVGLVKMDSTSLAPSAAMMLGAACLVCGLAAAAVLGEIRRWPFVLVMAGLMAGAQYLLAVWGLTPLAAFGAGLVGLGGSLLWGLIFSRRLRNHAAGSGSPPARNSGRSAKLSSALGSYGGLSLAMILIVMVVPIRECFNRLALNMAFPEVVTRTNFVTPPGSQVFRSIDPPGDDHPDGGGPELFHIPPPGILPADQLAAGCRRNLALGCSGDRWYHFDGGALGGDGSLWDDTPACKGNEPGAGRDLSPGLSPGRHPGGVCHREQ